MTRHDDILPARDRQTLASLQLLARGVVEGFVTGLHRSPHRGQSVEFRQHRPYVPGDDLRSLDWKIFGKTDRFFVKEFEEETNLRATLLLDQSGSMAYGRDTAGGVSKLDYASQIAAALAHLLLRQQDAVGLATFDSTVRGVVPPRSNPSHLTPLIEAMLAAEPAGEADPVRVVRDLSKRLRRRGLVVILSDCFGDVPRLMRALAELRRARHEVVIVQVLHRDEIDFPFAGRVRFDDLELADNRREFDARRLRRRYIAAMADFRQRLRDACVRGGADLVPAVVGEPVGDVLRAYLSRRRRVGRVVPQAAEEPA